MGAELTVGFTVTGLLDRAPVTLAGGQAGDALILTKPDRLGRDPRRRDAGQGQGEDVLACWEAMALPQGGAAAVLAPVAKAMTDVTGFGLAGHLWNICAASGTGAELSLDAVPFLEGAEALAERGVRSTLFAQNRAALDCVLGPGTGHGGPSVRSADRRGSSCRRPEAEADAASCRALRRRVPAARIGRLTDRPGDRRDLSSVDGTGQSPAPLLRSPNKIAVPEDAHVEIRIEPACQSP
jgi:selenide,water dikinase